MTGIVLHALLVFVTVGFFQQAADSENEPPLLWAGTSLLLWGVSTWLLHWGILGGLLLQVGLFVAITLRNMLRGRPPA